MEPEIARWLVSPIGTDALTKARSLTGDSLARSALLRKAGYSADEASALLTQAELQARPGSPPGWLLSRDGLEQSTNPLVASRRGALLAAAGVERVIDATAGLGFDADGFVRAGLEVTAIERDAVTATFLAHNVPQARVIEGDTTALLASHLAETDAVFLDPARRVSGQRTADGLRAQSERDPERWSPPLSWIVGLANTTKIVVKVAPGFRDVPPGWRAEWVSVNRSVVEATLWSFPAIEARQAVVIDERGAHVLASTDITKAAAADEPRGFLIEPDPAVTAAGIGSELAIAMGASTIDGTHWLTGDTAASSPFARRYVIEEELPSAPKELRTALRDRGIENPTIKSVGTGIDAERMRRELKAASGTEAVIALIRVGERIRAYRITAA